MAIPGNIFGDQAHTSSREKQHDISVADVTAAILRRETLTGKHCNGEQLHKTQLAVQLQVSRNAIRQVYRKLESEGLFTHIPRRGAFITSFDKERIRGLYVFCHVAECGTLRSLSTSQTKLLGEEILSICGSQSSLNPPERNNAFHLAIIRASGSPDLLATTKSIQAQLRLCLPPYPQNIELHARHANRRTSIAKVLIEDTSNHAAGLPSTYPNKSFGIVAAALLLADRS